ncbi:hypothetical protein BDZ90DRAFT_231252 [Jaminaea rosea]|uniref:Man1/Src1 C-terminal domain-containing protein n=1 Tax=Jaminaea rosea TaxID=1569628 RepID=A0A316USI2_9BASI|nr:hypothetical protein BDZ90DRAFT_231252 [Jaminaea rosea]PWN28256.1 hypothetical protein BDZ90DRAFT_231252 [Jaminaea rosea]
MPPTTPRAVDTSDPTFSPQALRIVDLRALLSGHGVVLPSSARKADLVEAVEEHIMTPQRMRARRGDGAKIKADEQEEDDSEEMANFSHENPFQASPSLHKGKRQQQQQQGPRKSVPTASTSRPSSSSGGAAGQQRRKTMDPSAMAARKPSTSTSNGIARSSSSSSKRAPSSSSFKAKSAAFDSSPPHSPSYTSYVDPSIAAGGSPEGWSSPTEEKERAPLDTRKPAHAQRSSPLLASRRKSARKLSITRPHPPRDAVAIIATIARYVVALLMAVWYLWYAKESHAIGYCDTGTSTHTNSYLNQQAAQRQLRKSSDDQTLVDLVVPSFLQPGCTPCPAHAHCSSGALLGCESDEYVLRPALLSHLPGVARRSVPHGWQASSCRTDSRRLELIDELADEIFRRVAGHVGGVICGRAKPSAKLLKYTFGTKNAAAAGPEWRRALLASDLRAQLREATRGNEGISDEYFAHLWSAALQELEDEHPASGRDSVWQSLLIENGENQDQERLLLVSLSAARIPFTCRLRLSFSSFLRRISGPVGLLSLLLGTAAWLRSRFRRSRSEARLVEGLVEEVTTRLAQQALESALADSSIGLEEVPPYLPVHQLRDSLLSSYKRELGRGRGRVVWTAVTRRVEANSNVRTGMKRWKGEWMRVWEWVGVVGGSGSGAGAGSRPSTPRASRPGSVKGIQSGEEVLQQQHDGEGQAVAEGAVEKGESGEQPEMQEKVEGKAYL